MEPMKPSDVSPAMKWVPFPPALADRFGDNAAVLLGWLIFRTAEPGAEVEARLEEIQGDTGLSPFRIRQAVAAVADLIEIREDRLAHRRFWRLDVARVRALVGPAEPPPTPRQSPNSRNCTSRTEETSLRGILDPVEPPQTGGQPDANHPNSRNFTSGTEGTSSREAKKLQSVEEKKEEKKKKRKEKTPSLVGADTPATKAIVQAFARVFGERFRDRYVPDPKADVAAARALILAGVTADEVAAVFDRATRTKGFWSSKVTTLPMLAKRWNEVRAEQRTPTPGGKPDGQTAEAWRSELGTAPEDKGTK